MIKVVAVGKIKEKSLLSLIDEYKKRLSGYTKFEIVEVDDEQIPKVASKAIEDNLKEIEGLKILSKIKDNDFVVLLDLHGTDFDSLAMAKKIENILANCQGNIIFVIGGSLGLGTNILNRANLKWKLSSCTFTHQHVRLLVVEQIYRFYKINGNETYHK